MRPRIRFELDERVPVYRRIEDSIATSIAEIEDAECCGTSGVARRQHREKSRRDQAH